MVKGFLKGNIRLIIVYWVYGVLVGLAYVMLGLFIERNYLRIILSPFSQFFTYGFIVFPFIYFPFIYVSIWRSANRYTKNKIWKNLAKASVVLGAIFLLMIGIKVISDIFLKSSLNNQLAQSVTIINRNLPMMIDKETQLTQVSFQNHIYSYHYKLINKDAKEVDTEGFISFLHSGLIKQVCSDNNLVKILTHGINISYSYIDKKGSPVADIIIKLTDCQQPNQSTKK